MDNNDLIAYLKAAEISQIPGDKYRYYYNIIENFLPYEYSWLIFLCFTQAYNLGVTRTFDAFVDIIENPKFLIKNPKKLELVNLDVVGPIFRDKVDRLQKIPSDDVAQLLEKSDEVEILHKLINGSLRGELNQIWLSIKIISKSEFVNFFNSTEGCFYLKNIKWNNLGKIDPDGREDLYLQVARRIYRVRNMVIHSKDDDNPRVPPFSKDEVHLVKEIPLIKFIGEKFISIYQE